MNQKSLFLFLIFFVVAESMVARTGFGQADKLNQNWKFILQDVKDGEQIELNDQRWEMIDLPHDWSIRQPLSSALASCMGYLPGGTGWYRKQFTVPADRE